MNQNNTFFIKGNIPSLKNSKVMGRFPSKTVMKWLRSYGIQSFHSDSKTVKYFKRIPKEHDMLKIVGDALKTDEYPIVIGFHFVRGSKHKWDFQNILQIITDLWTALGLIPDDNMDYIIPMPMQIDGKWYSYDNKNPGCIVKVFKKGETIEL